MNESSEFRIRWLSLGGKTREVYALPGNVPWPETAPPPSTEDCFLNISALGAAADACEEERWKSVAEFCQLCEQGTASMENFNYNDALDALKEAEEVHGCAFIHWQRCICHLELKQGEQAMAAAYHATSMAPQCGVFWRVYGEICQERGLLEESGVAFERAFFGGEHSSSVISSMRKAGLLVPSPGGGSDLLVSPSVAGAVLKTHIFGLLGHEGNMHRLRELAEEALKNKTTSEAALMATSHLIQSNPDCFEDELRHAEALAKSSRWKEAEGILNDAVGKGSQENLVNSAERILRVLDGDAPFEFSPLAEKLLATGRLSRGAKKMIFERWKTEILEPYSENENCGLAMMVLAERIGRTNRTAEAIELAERVGGTNASAETKIDAAKILLEFGECEKVCAILSSMEKPERGIEGCFLFGEALWRMGVGDQADGHFSEVLKLSNQDPNDSFFYNSQMRSAQCRGLLRPMAEPTTLSPTKRLGRSILVSNPHWSSVIAPAGLPSSSYVRIRIEKDVEACSYHLSELSRQDGEQVIGEFSPQTKHDEICLAIESSGRIFAGAKWRGEWVEASIPQS